MTGMIPTPKLGRRNVTGVGMTLLALAIFVYAFFAAQDFRDVSSWFPIGVSAVGFLLSLAVLLWEAGIIRVGSSESFEAALSQDDEDAEPTTPAWRSFLVFMAWLVVLVAAMMTVGAPIAILVWLLLFFRFRSRESWIRSALYSLAAVVSLWILVAFLHMFLPTGSLIPSGDWIPHLLIRF